MLETKDLLIDKAKQSDWAAMYKNVWSHPESARYMQWRVTANEDDAQIRMQKTIAFQQAHNTYLVYEKTTGEAIGFAGVEQLGPCTYEEAGICLGPEFVRKGYGRQIVTALIQYCKEDLGATAFVYSTRANNEASKGLAHSLGFRLFRTEERIDEKDGQHYFMQKYFLKL